MIQQMSIRFEIQFLIEYFEQETSFLMNPHPSKHSSPLRSTLNFHRTGRFRTIGISSDSASALSAKLGSFTDTGTKTKTSFSTCSRARRRWSRMTAPIYFCPAMPRAGLREPRMPIKSKIVRKHLAAIWSSARAPHAMSCTTRIRSGFCTTKGIDGVYFELTELY